VPDAHDDDFLSARHRLLRSIEPPELATIMARARTRRRRRRVVVGAAVLAIAVLAILAGALL
jgi:hypothetical protein